MVIVFLILEKLQFWQDSFQHYFPALMRTGNMYVKSFRKSPKVMAWKPYFSVERNGSINLSSTCSRGNIGNGTCDFQHMAF